MSPTLELFEKPHEPSEWEVNTKGCVGSSMPAADAVPGCLYISSLHLVPHPLPEHPTPPQELALQLLSTKEDKSLDV